MLSQIVAALLLCIAATVIADPDRIICHNEEFGLVKAFYGVDGCPDHFTLFENDGIRGPVGQVRAKCTRAYDYSGYSAMLFMT